MSYNLLKIMIILALISPVYAARDGGGVEPAPNGIELPENYRDWSVVSSSHRIDNHTLRVIVGNEIAVKAARTGQTNPWPNGAILGKLVWKEAAQQHWPKAIAPGKFVHAEFMIKDSQAYENNGTGWQWARWVGTEQKPYGNDADFSKECISCHTPVKSRDWVFTSPAQLP